MDLLKCEGCRYWKAAKHGEECTFRWNRAKKLAPCEKEIERREWYAHLDKENANGQLDVRWFN